MYLLKCLGFGWFVCFFLSFFFRTGFLHLMFNQQCVNSQLHLSMCTALHLSAAFQISKDVINVHHSYLTPWISLYIFGKSGCLCLAPTRIGTKAWLQYWPTPFICHQDGFCFYRIFLHSTPKQFSLLQQQTCWFSWLVLPHRTMMPTELGQGMGHGSSTGLNTKTPFVLNQGSSVLLNKYFSICCMSLVDFSES